MQFLNFNLADWVLIILTGCALTLNACGSGGDSTPSEPPGNNTGGISFQLHFEPRSDEPGLAVHKEAVADADVCADHLIQGI